MNEQDIQLWGFFLDLTMGQSSWSDFNLDGKTNDTDLGIYSSTFRHKVPSEKMTTFILLERTMRLTKQNNLSLFTSLRWFVSLIMPDILGPALYLSIYLLVFAGETISPRTAFDRSSDRLVGGGFAHHRVGSSLG